MSYLEIILPFGIPPAAFAPDLQKTLNAPCLARLLTHARIAKTCQFDEYSHALPHEALLGGKLHADDFWPKTPTTLKKLDASAANTHRRMQTFGLTPEAGHWFTLFPVHIHFERDHLVLTDQRRLDFTEQEARALFQEAQTLCAEFGHTLLYGDRYRWFLRADDWHDMQTASKDAACGHNIDIWMAKGTHARQWRKLQNEIQMHWFQHQINQEREARGENPVNSLWLEAGSAGLDEVPAVLSKDDGLSLLKEGVSAPLLSSDFPQHRIVLDDLMEAALNNDWGYWLERLHALDQQYFPAIEEALTAKRFGQIQLAVSDAQQLSAFPLQTPRSWKFWKKPSLRALFALNLPQTNPLDLPPDSV